MGIYHENSNNVEHLEDNDIDDFMEFNNSQDACEYCGGKVQHVRGGYKDDEVVAVCSDCGMVDPR